MLLVVHLVRWSTNRRAGKSSIFSLHLVSLAQKFQIFSKQLLVVWIFMTIHIAILGLQRTEPSALPLPEDLFIVITSSGHSERTGALMLKSWITYLLTVDIFLDSRAVFTNKSDLEEHQHIESQSQS